MTMVPFFVADRPMSLRLLRTLPLEEYQGVRIGIMAHANTTANFQDAYRRYPAGERGCCCEPDGNETAPHAEDPTKCPTYQYIRNHTIKMCDSGMFTREGATLNYKDLFDVYVRMGVNYGIMIDVFLDAQATIESAKQALKVYKPYRNKFKLVAVAQGTTEQEYMGCYATLRMMGFKHIAVGGLLRRRTNTVRFPYVRDERFMFEVLGKLHQKYPNDWLFALGSFNPSRLKELASLGVWADYKGWIFQYEKRDSTLHGQLETLTTNHLEHVDLGMLGQETAERISTIQQLVSARHEAMQQYAETSQALFDGRRTLRSGLETLHANLKSEPQHSTVAMQIQPITTHGLLDNTEARRVADALALLGQDGTPEGKALLENIQRNHGLRTIQRQSEAKLEALNRVIVQNTVVLTVGGQSLPDEVLAFCRHIEALVTSTERDHRFSQVKADIANRILSALV